MPHLAHTFDFVPPAGDDMSLTFSDGLTKSGTNVTNDLVTGTIVAQINALATGSATLSSGAALSIVSATGGITIAADAAGGVDISDDANGQVRVHSLDVGTVEISQDTTGAHVRIQTLNGNVDIASGAAGTTTVTGGSELTLQATGAASLISGAAGMDINSAGGMDVSAATTLVLAAAGNISVDATLGTGDIEIKTLTDSESITLLSGLITAHATQVNVRGEAGVALFVDDAANRISIGVDGGGAPGIQIVSAAGGVGKLSFFGLPPISQVALSALSLGAGATLTQVINLLNEVLAGLGDTSGTGYGLFTTT